MTGERKYTGFAIALAWPQTFCKEPGSWYDPVRSADTDHDLKMNTIPEITADDKTISNFQEILEELQHNPACHGHP